MKNKIMTNRALLIAQKHQRLFMSLVFLIGFCLFSSFTSLSAQTVSGVLTGDDGIPLIGVNVLVDGTDVGTITDIDGSYSLAANDGDVLVFSYVGYKDTRVTVGEGVNYSFDMAADAATLDEIVVIGYGTSKKSHLTGAISKVDNKDLDRLPVARVDDALVGQVSGVNIQATEGEAGSAPTIRIRGTGSMTAGASPLIVVDGLVVDNDFLGSLDMNDVASFEILKDAASCAIYGSRGANGVILISTKDGAEGKTKFSYNGYFGKKSAHQSEAYYFSLADAAAAELAANDTLSHKTIYKQQIGVDQDWQDIIFDGGNIQSHSFSARGGDKKTNFSATFGYLHDEGVLLTDDFKKYNMNFKVKTKINDRLSFGASIAPSYTNRRRFAGSTHDILRQPPWLPLYHTEETLKFVNDESIEVGDYAVQSQFNGYDLYGDSTKIVNISSTSNTNPGAKVLEREQYEYRFKMFGSTFLQFKLTDEIKFRTVLAGDFQNTDRSHWRGVLHNRNGASAARLDVENFTGIHLSSENYFTYDKEYGAHEVNAVLGFSAEKWDFKESYAGASGYDSDLLKTITAGTTVLGQTTEAYQDRFLSQFARVNYAFDYKYLLSASVRRDGSSRFGPNKKYGVFPAISAGWVVSEEGFLANNSAVNFLKFRVSYGLTGNNDLDAYYPSIALLGTTTAVVDGSVSGGIGALNIANNDLGWESSKEINPGIDFALFNDFLSGSVDFYRRTSDGLLLENPISATTGFSNALVNLGQVENKGYELELRTNNISNSDMRWSTTFIASQNKNTLLDFADSDGQIQSVDSKRAAEWINLEGQPISSFYGWVVDSDINQDYLKEAFNTVGGEAEDVYVRDLNGDGLIDDDDKAIIGNPYPDLVWSVGNNLSFGLLDFGFMFQGSHGAQVRNMGDQYLFNQFNSGQDFTSEAPNPGFIKKKIFTDDIVQDADYLSLRNVNIGYNLRDVVKGVSNARVYVAAQNLWYSTAANYTGFNPEAIKEETPTTYGYQRAGSPINKTFTVGLNLEF